ncbi:FAD-dependent monooxygenase [Aestuariibius insulae]|uniref:FAD-dependent monooxygenase n=1 Tax=Aestuariibius insulae TaxID=2058287 RepID=UPI00345ECC9A
MKAIIAGGGIGGLTAALALSRIGWDVTVLERADTPGEVGAGVQISPNGMRVLRWLDVAADLEPFLFEPEAIEMRLGQSGRPIFSLPVDRLVGGEDGRGPLYVQVHRADLVQVLRARLEAVTPGRFLAGQIAIGYRQTAHGAEVELATGERLGGDLVLGADGIGSVFARQMHPDIRPTFSGYAAWRMLVPVDQLEGAPPPPTGCIWVGRGRHVVTTRVRKGDVVNLVGVVETPDWDAEGWGTKESASDALSDFDGWHPSILSCLRSVDVIWRWGLFERDPLPSWSDGSVGLLGDAAHPMLPSMAQGAVQAMEDAAVLARLLERKTVREALPQYYELRSERSQRIAALSARNVRLFHKKNALARAATYGPAWLAGRLAPGVLKRRSSWIYDFDPTE